jgi:hypothetical protein
VLAGGVWQCATLLLANVTAPAKTSAGTSIHARMEMRFVCMRVGADFVEAAR